MTPAQIRTRAGLETGAALNHEINNPLMALLGNVELLLRETQHLDEEITTKLTKIHEAAEHIRIVTHKLMSISEARSVLYPGGGTMLDIEGSPKHVVKA